MRKLKQSTAFTFRIGPFVDSTDGVTPETALTITQSDIRLSKAGGAFAQKSDTTSSSHDENGWYTVVLNTTDTATLGMLDIAINMSGALPVWETLLVQSANVYDSLIGNTDKLDVGTAEALTTNNDKTGYAISGTKTTLDALNDVSTAQVNAEVDTALADYDGPTNAEMEARTLPFADYFDPSTDEVITDSASRTASKADVSGLASQASIDALNDFDPATDTVARVTLVDTTTTNTDMVGTNNAATEAKQNIIDSIIDAIFMNTNTEIPTMIENLKDFDPLSDSVNVGKLLGHSLTETTAGRLSAGLSYFFDVATPSKTMNDAGVSGAGLTAKEVWEYATRELTSAGSSGATAQEVWEYANRSITSGNKDSVIDAILEDTASSIPGIIASLHNVSVSEIWSEETRTLTGFGTLIAEVWAYANRTLTSGTKDTEIDSILNNTSSSLPTQIGLISPLSASQTKDQIDLSLAEYDGVTRDEATADKLSILSSISNLNNISASDVSSVVDSKELVTTTQFEARTLVNSEYVKLDSPINSQLSLSQSLDVLSCIFAGKFVVSVGEDGTSNIVTFRDLDDEKDILTITNNEFGNRVLTVMNV